MNTRNFLRVCSVILFVGCVACAPNVDSDPESAPSPETTPEPEPDVAVAPSDQSSEAVPDGITITVDIAKLRNSDGMAQVTLYDKEDEFLSEDSETARIVRVEIEGDKSSCQFSGVKPGKYAVALMHDEDGDGKMKKSLIGLPKEGIGMSNDAKPKFGPPKWEDAVFEVGEEDVSITISMLYM